MLTADLTHPHTKAAMSVEFYVTESEASMLVVVLIYYASLRKIFAKWTKPYSGVAADTRRITESDVLDRFGDHCDGKLGLLEGEVHLEIDPNVASIKMSLRRISVTMRERVKTELQYRDQRYGPLCCSSSRNKMAEYEFASIQNR